MKNILFLSLGLVAALLPAQAMAGGFILPNTGARAGGMAGAFVAQGDDLSVMDHNPAQLVRQNRYAFEVHYTGYLFESSFDPKAVEGLGGGPMASNTGDYLNHIPNLYGVIPVGERWRFGIGLFTPVGPRHTYSGAGAQRYQVTSAQVQLAWPTVAAAYKIRDNLAASLSLDVAVVMADQSMAVGLIPGFRSFDGTLQVEGSGVQIPRPKLGVLYAPTEKLNVGLVAMPGLDLKINGKVRADVPQAGLHANTHYDDIVAKQRAPTEARLGVAWLEQKWHSEATLRYYRWSEYKAQEIDLKRNRIGDFAIADISMKKFYEDTFAFQLGGGYKLFDNHEVRAGYMFDMAAAQPEGVTLQDFDANKHGLAIGYGYKVGSYSFDVAYDRVMYEDLDVNNSATTPISVLGTPPALGNGTYHWAVNMFYVRAGVDF